MLIRLLAPVIDDGLDGGQFVVAISVGRGLVHRRLAKVSGLRGGSEASLTSRISSFPLPVWQVRVTLHFFIWRHMLTTTILRQFCRGYTNPRMIPCKCLFLSRSIERLACPRPLCYPRPIFCLRKGTCKARHMQLFAALEAPRNQTSGKDPLLGINLYMVVSTSLAGRA